MGSLTHCVKKIGINKRDLETIAANAKIYKSEGYEAGTHHQAAVSDLLKEKRVKRSDIVRQIMDYYSQQPATPEPPSIPEETSTPVEAAASAEVPSLISNLDEILESKDGQDLIANSPAIPDFVADIFERILQKLGMTTKIILVSSEEMNNTDFGKQLQGWILRSRPLADPANMSGGKFWRGITDDSGHSFSVVAINSKYLRTDTKLIGILAHEVIGHAVFFDQWDNAGPELQAKIWADFAAARADILNGHPQASANFFEPIVNQFAAKNQILADTSDKLFYEWVAHQISKTVLSSRPAQTIIEKFWSKVASKIRQLYGEFKKGGFAPVTGVESIQEFVTFLYKKQAKAKQEAAQLGIENFNAKLDGRWGGLIRFIYGSMLQFNQETGRLEIKDSWLEKKLIDGKLVYKLRRLLVEYSQKGRAPVSEGMARESLFKAQKKKGGGWEVVAPLQDVYGNTVEGKTQVLFSITAEHYPQLAGLNGVRWAEKIAQNIRDMLIVSEYMNTIGQKRKQEGMLVTKFAELKTKSVIDDEEYKELIGLHKKYTELADQLGIPPQQFWLEIMSGIHSPFYELQKTGMRGTEPLTDEEAMPQEKKLLRNLQKMIRQSLIKKPRVREEILEALAISEPAATETAIQQLADESRAEVDAIEEPSMEEIQMYLDQMEAGDEKDALLRELKGLMAVNLWNPDNVWVEHQLSTIPNQASDELALEIFEEMYEHELRVYHGTSRHIPDVPTVDQASPNGLYGPGVYMTEDHVDEKTGHLIVTEGYANTGLDTRHRMKVKYKGNDGRFSWNSELEKALIAKVREQNKGGFPQSIGGLPDGDVYRTYESYDKRELDALREVFHNFGYETTDEVAQVGKYHPKIYPLDINPNPDRVIDMDKYYPAQRLLTPALFSLLSKKDHNILPIKMLSSLFLSTKEKDAIYFKLEKEFPDLSMSNPDLDIMDGALYVNRMEMREKKNVELTLAAIQNSTKEIKGSDFYNYLSQIMDKGALNMALRDAKFDFITHIGGSITGGVSHRVWIALKDGLIKSAFSEYELAVKRGRRKALPKREAPDPYAEILKKIPKERKKRLSSKTDEERKAEIELKREKRREKLQEFLLDMRTMLMNAQRENKPLADYMKELGIFTPEEIRKMIAKYHANMSRFSQSEIIMRLATHLGLVNEDGNEALMAIIRFTFPPTTIEVDGKSVLIPGAVGRLDELEAPAKEVLITNLQKMILAREGQKYDYDSEETLQQRKNALIESEKSESVWKKLARLVGYIENQASDRLMKTAAGRELVYRLKRTMLQQTLYQRDWISQLNEIGKLYESPEQREHLYDVLTNQVAPANATEVKFKELIRTINHAYAMEMELLQVQILYKDKRLEFFKYNEVDADNYFPHMWEPGDWEKPNERMIQSLIDGGDAIDREHALKLIKKHYHNYIRVQKFPNIEMARETELGGWITDPIKVYQRYVTGASRKLALLKEFGATPDLALAQFAIKHFKEGNDSEGLKNARDLINRVLGIQVEEPLSRDPRFGMSYGMLYSVGLLLQHAFIVQPGVATNMTMVGGFKNLIKGIAEVGPELFKGRSERYKTEWAKTAGVLAFTMNRELYDIVSDDKTRAKSDKLLRSFGVTQIDGMMRIIGAMTGKMYAIEQAIDYANAPSEKGALRLKRLGLNPKSILERANPGVLEEEELRMAALAFTEETNFVINPLNVPNILKGHPLGRIFLLFSRFAFQQHHLWKTVLRDSKGKALKGVLAGITVGAPMLLLKMLLTGDDPEKVLKEDGIAKFIWRAFVTGAGPGIFLEGIGNALFRSTGPQTGTITGGVVDSPMFGLIDTLGRGGKGVWDTFLGNDTPEDHKAMLRAAIMSLQAASIGLLPDQVGVPLNAGLGWSRPLLEKALTPTESSERKSYL